MMRGGFGKRTITPPLGTLMGGHPGIKRAEGVLDDLHVRVMALELAEQRLVFASLDVLFVSGVTVSKIRGLVEQQYALAPENVHLFATHTHSGPLTTGLFGQDNELEYLDRLEQEVAKAIGEALEALMPVRLTWAQARVEDLVANARYIMRDGHIETHPWKGSSEILKVEGPVDNEMLTLAVSDKQGRWLGALVNYPNHPQVLERDCTLLSSDFPGRMEQWIHRKLKDDRPVILFGNGACGNLCPVDPMRTDRCEVGEAWMDEMGRSLANAWCEAISGAVSHDLSHLSQYQDVLDIAIRDIPDEKLSLANDFLMNQGDEPDRELHVSNYGVEPSGHGTISLEEYLMTPEWKRQEYRDLLKLAERKSKNPNVSVPISILRINDVAIVFLPFELFTEIGLEIKRRSPFLRTMLIELANGSLGYVPTAKAFERPGSYETMTLTSSQLVPEAADQLIQRVLDGLARIKD